MNIDFIEDVYNTLHGVMVKGYEVPGVESIFEAGMLCDQLYGNMLDAYERLCDRLGVMDEDEDVEVIINSLMQISREVGNKMYRYGAAFGKTSE